MTMADEMDFGSLGEKKRAIFCEIPIADTSMQKYLSYCKKHGITRNYLVKKEGYDGIDAMQFYDKSAIAKFEKNRKTRNQCR